MQAELASHDFYLYQFICIPILWACFKVLFREGVLCNLCLPLSVFIGVAAGIGLHMLHVLHAHGYTWENLLVITEQYPPRLWGAIVGLLAMMWTLGTTMVHLLRLLCKRQNL